MSNPAAADRVSVIVVLYNSADDLERCIRSVPETVELVVVDNASTDDGARVAQDARPDALVLREDHNRGFGAGCNVGAKHATREILVFLNPDAQFADGAVEHIVKALDAPGVGLVGPALTATDGELQLTCRKWSALAQDFAESLPSWAAWGPAWLRRDIPGSSPIYTDGGAVPYTQGACMAMSAAGLEEIGGFDEDLFLYGEEESLALRFARRRLHSIYVPRASVIHIGGTSIGKVGTLANYHLARSRVLLYRKRTHRRLPVALVLAGALAMSTLVAVAKALVGRERDGTYRGDGAALRGVWAGATASLSHTPQY